MPGEESVFRAFCGVWDGCWGKPLSTAGCWWWRWWPGHPRRPEVRSSWCGHTATQSPDLGTNVVGNDVVKDLGPRARASATLLTHLLEGAAVSMHRLFGLVVVGFFRGLCSTSLHVRTSARPGNVHVCF